ncbi:MAG: hydroxyacid dehydrogenase [Clostridia bacterium]|nr:hydroxyacid dehydrogenase [Clostridia bacterium]
MKILVTGAWQCTPEQLDEIRCLGNEVVFMQNEKDELPVSPSEIEGAICNGLFLYHDIKEFTALKYIQLTSAGFDRVPMEHVKDKNIKIFNARGVYSIPMAEFAVAGVLQMYKQSKFFALHQAEHKWVKHRGLLELYNKHVCIVGCGNVGTECAKRFNAFGCVAFGVDLYPRVDENYTEMYSLDELDKALSKADIVILTLPLTEETRHLFNGEKLSKMKTGAILVNIARGAVVETSALIEALGGHLGGAVLDVFEEEPLGAGNSLWGMENVILSPHNSFVGDGNSDRLQDCILSNIRKV